MQLSLLNREKAKAAVSNSAIYHFSLDRVFSEVCADAEKRNYFLSVIAAPLDSDKEINYRRDVLRELYENRHVLQSLSSLLFELCSLRDQKKKAARVHFGVQAQKNTSPESARNALQGEAALLKRILLALLSIDGILGEDISSEGLLCLKSAICEITRKPQFTELLNACTDYEDLSLSRCTEFAFHIENERSGVKYSLMREMTVPVPEERRGIFRAKKEKTADKCIIIEPESREDRKSVTVSALSDIAYSLSSIARELLERFCPIYRQLDFYAVAIEYTDRCRHKGLPLCYGKHSDEKLFEITELYDPLLAFTAPDSRNIVPHSFKTENGCNGILILGDSGSGKTVLLRSIGCAQLLHQAGLPVTAKEASFPDFSAIISHFAEAEKNFTAGNSAGRFEQEVAELAKTVDTVCNGSAVFLNEIFQSTDHKEGAAALFDILDYVNDTGAIWLLVTHLADAAGLFANKSIKILHINEEHQIDYK